MKTIINALIVVEGKTDIDFLSSFIDADFYMVGGSSVSQNDYDFINEYLLKKDVIVLTDPDFPGKQIRDKINDHCYGVKNAFIRKELSIKKNKVGVAESTKEEVLNALNNSCKLTMIKDNPSIKITDLYNLGLIGNSNSSKKRRFIEEKFHIGFTNGKTLLKRLNMLNISYDKLEKVLKDVK